MQHNKERLLLLTLVHPDFLPPVYATAQSLRDLNYDITIVTFDSFVPAPVELGENISVETLGKHHNVPLKQRMALRSKFKKHAQQKLAEGGFKAIIAFCPFSFNTGVQIKGGIPLMYYAMETANFTIADLKRSPLTAISAYKTLHSLTEASFVATPSFQRSAWLAGRCGLNFMPETILNTAYITNHVKKADDREVLKAILPDWVFDKKMVLYTGAVNDRLCVKELVEAYDQLNDTTSILIVTGFKDNAYCKSIKDYVAGSKNKESIFLLPYVTREEMLALQGVADIGACLMKEIPGMIASQMLAPNKTGEYLSKGLYVLGVKNFYMNMFEAAGVGSLAATASVPDISAALREAMKAIGRAGYKDRISNYVQEYFCMQKQAAPMADALKKMP
ncbi:hypothetical protein CJD36_009910 [Flavipsychrobacter stenotrophus]|uniref:Glycosyltransferase n=1 Tax=Flavipsychrobacter stenotrophus TaxID=2077091 RepID=A0A2S7SYR8_9BACT|nr:hypothetical protein [Flavipsychrobacter stenotrophus]PQJ12093.1 hypothetical protein CJD36_009910 [Flavipsychrobacter stenotrophus]